jgi:uncharacterized membrane protein YgcG
LVFFALVLPALVACAAEIPPAPRNHIYDPDFLITRQVTMQLAETLSEMETKSDLTVYLAIYTTVPGLLDETARDLSQAWNQSGYGVVVVFVPSQQQARVVPSPQLSLEADAAQLTKIFQDATVPDLAHGDYSAAAAAGTAAISQALEAAQAKATAPPEKPLFHLSRKWIFGIFDATVLAGLVFFWVASRVWRSANLFDYRYRFSGSDEPAALRFGGARCGGQMATMNFRAPLNAKNV